MRTTLAAATLALLALPAPAQDGGGQMHGSHDGSAVADAPRERASFYAGQEDRGIAGLSAEDVAALRRGEGWGLALPAELNGLPGPTHLLEMRNELGLNAAQMAAVTTMRDAMRVEAIAAGERFVAAEEALDQAFREGDLDQERLRILVGVAEAARAEMRLVHLSRHLATPALLDPRQVERYRELRGYGPRSLAP